VIKIALALIAEMLLAERQVDDGLVTGLKPVTLAREIGAMSFMQPQHLAEKLLFCFHQRRRGLDVDVVKIHSAPPDPGKFRAQYTR
jgi:hypothetical protein